MKQLRLLVVLLAVLGLLATACGSDDGTTDDTGSEVEVDTPTDDEGAEPAADDEAEAPADDDEAAAEDDSEAEPAPVVRADADLVIWADDTRVGTIRPFAESFGEDNGLTVAVQEVAFGDIRDRLVTAGPAGEGPDVIIGAHDWLGGLVTSGLVAPVDLGANASAFSPVGIEAMSYEGQLYGVPYAIENIALIRNTDLVPEAPATFADLETVALALVESGDAEIPLGLQEVDVYHNFPLFTGAGGYLFGTNSDGSYDAQDIGIDSPEGLAAAAKFKTWVDSGLISADVNYDIMIEKFAAGTAPFAITGPWATSAFKDAGVNYVVEPIPSIDGGTPAPFVGVQGFMVSAQAKNPLFAQTFITEVMATEEAQTALYEAGDRPPAHTAAFEKASANADVQGFGAAGQNGQPLPAIPAMGSVWTAWTDGYTVLFSGEADPDAAFTGAAEQIRTLIAEGS